MSSITSVAGTIYLYFLTSPLQMPTLHVDWPGSRMQTVLPGANNFRDFAWQL